MADDKEDTPSSQGQGQTSTTPAKEKELWGVPLSTWYGLGIVAVGTVSLITALKVLIPPGFTLFPQQNQQQLQQPNIFGLMAPTNTAVNQGNGGNGNNMQRPQIDNSTEDYEVYDDTDDINSGPSNIDVDIGSRNEDNIGIDERQNQGNEREDLISVDDRAFRANEPIIKSNSGISVTISPDVVKSQRMLMRPKYNNPEADIDVYYE